VCKDCDKSFYCAGGDFVTGVTTSKLQCPSGMTTIGLRTETIRGCGKSIRQEMLKTG